MKIARFTHQGSTRLGVVFGDEIADVGADDPTLPPDVGVLLASNSLDDAIARVDSAPRVPLASVRLEAPISRPPEFLAVGLNYRLHAEEGGFEVPEVPSIFNKQSTCVNGPFDPIDIPAAAPDEVDYEGELGIVIGAPCRSVPVAEALSVVAGYLVVNDVSVRDWQMRSSTVTMGKSWDTHGPIGPWLVTADEVGDPQTLGIRTWVDDELRQSDSTGTMIFSCAEIIHHLSTAFTLLPGTIISTGTPAGVGFTMDPPRYLAPGQRVRVEIDRIGGIENTCRSTAPDEASAAERVAR